MMPSTPTRVLLVDDHEMTRKGLAAYLKSYDDLTIIGEAANGVEALEVCSQAHPDVVLMDIGMPKMDGIAATQAITRLYPGIRVIILSSFHDEYRISAALQAGANGYLLKESLDEKLVSAIRAANNGDHFNREKDV